MKTPSAPTPPDPKVTAGAQTATNIGTAIANANLQNVNQETPYGNLTYQQTIDRSYINRGGKDAKGVGKDPTRFYLGNDPSKYQNGFATREAAERFIRNNNISDAYQTQTYTDPNTGDTYDIPSYTAVQTMSPEMQRMYDLETEAGTNMAQIAANQSARIGDHLSREVDTSNLPDAGSADAVRSRNMQMVSKPQRSLGGRIEDAGDLTRSISSQTQGIVGDVMDRTGELVRNVRGQNYQTEFGDAGPLTRSYNTDFSQDRQRVEEALMSRMQPSLERDREGLRSRLLNQGIREGSEAYDRAMNRFDEQSNDARMQAILAGGQEQSRMVGLEADRAAFENSAQGQAYGQLLGRAQFGNDARQQQFSTDLARGQFANAATGQAADMDMSRANLANSAAAQRFDQTRGAAQFANEAQAQQFGQNAAQLDARNQAITGNAAMRADRIAQNNAARQQMFSNDMSLQARRDADRNAALQETFALRNQPINEIGALLGTGQVTQPSFVNTGVGAIPTTDVAGITMDNYGQQLAAWQQQVASRNNMMGGLLGAGGQLGAAAIMSDRRMKDNIVEIGRFGRLPVYSYRYKGEEQERVGFMADEVGKIAPEALVWLPGGFAAVDYDKAMEAAA